MKLLGDGKVEGTIWSGQTVNTSGAYAAPPQFSIMHYTAMACKPAIARLLGTDGNRASSAHFVIDRDGTIYQTCSINIIAWHAGKSRWMDRPSVNKFSIGIEQVNWGPLTKSKSGFESWDGVLYEGPEPIHAFHRNTPTVMQYWEPYSDALIAASLELVKTLGLPVLGHDEISPIRKSDPGPAFPMAQFR